MQTLVVVDMQPRQFEAARTDWMIKNVGREVRAAMEAMHTIIFLEYIIGTSVGVSVKDMTDPRLTNIVAGYDAAVVARKAISDGSEQVCAVLEEMGLAGGFAGRTNEIRVVGVETGVCLADTVNGLAEKMPGTRVIVVGDACNAAGGTFPEPHDRGQEQIKTGANVEILKAVGPLACGRPVS